MNEDIYSFLKSNHPEDNIELYSTKKLNWDFVEDINSKYQRREAGLLVFQAWDNTILFIGYTDYIQHRIRDIRTVYRPQPKNIYIVSNIIPNAGLNIASYYRSLYNPLLNKDINTKIIFNSDKILISEKRYKAYKDIRNNMSYKEFMSKYKQADLFALCKAFRCPNYSLEELRGLIKSNKKPFLIRENNTLLE